MWWGSNLVVLMTSDPWQSRSDTTKVLDMLGTTWRIFNSQFVFQTKPYLKLDLSNPQIRVEVWSENPRQV